MALIREAALEFILGVSRELYPREFVGLLRGREDVIEEVLVVPASLYGQGFAQVKWAHVPLDKSIIGSVHSHPSHNNKPSKTDLRYFNRTGDIHLIVAYPHKSISDIACYLRDGTPTQLTTS